MSETKHTVHFYIYICIYIYIHVYVHFPLRAFSAKSALQRTRVPIEPRSRNRKLCSGCLGLCSYLCISIYIHVYVYMYTCIYISLQMDAFVPLGCLCRFNRMRGSDRKIQAHVWMQGLVRRFIFHRAGQGRPCRAARGWSWFFSQGRPGKAIQGRSGISDRRVPSQQVGPLGSTLEDL